MIEAIRRARKINVLILDVDGVLTDGRLHVGENDDMRDFDIKDGHGIVIFLRKGFEVVFVTGRDSKSLERRAKELGIKRVYTGIKKKGEFYDKLKEEMGFSDEEVAFVGDDVVDLSIMKKVGFPVAVGDAVREVKREALYITKNPGGRGAVREVIELILKAKGMWDY